MSAARALDIEVYVRLLDEGVDVWRPVPAKPQAAGTFRLSRPEWYDPETETWEFLPETLVRCERKLFADGKRALVAVAEAP